MSSFVARDAASVARRALTEPKQWLTPKSDSLETFIYFLLRVLTVLALVALAGYLAIADKAPALSGAALLATVVALLRQRAAS
jgi:hypothetical protein